MKWRAPHLLPANIRLDKDILKTSWRRLSSSRRLQDALIKTNIFTLVIRLQKTSWSRPIPWFFIRLQDVFKTSCHNIFKTFSRRLAKTSSRHLQEVFKMFWRRLQDVFKTFSRRIAKTSARHLQNVFKTFCKNFIKTSSRRLANMSSRRFQDVSSGWTALVNTSSRRIQQFLRRTAKKVIYRTICLGHTHLWKIYGQCTKFARVEKICQVLVFHFTTPFSGCLQRRI